MTETEKPRSGALEDFLFLEKNHQKNILEDALIARNIFDIEREVIKSPTILIGKEEGTDTRLRERNEIKLRQKYLKSLVSMTIAM